MPRPRKPEEYNEKLFEVDMGRAVDIANISELNELDRGEMYCNLMEKYPWLTYADLGKRFGKFWNTIGKEVGWYKRYRAIKSCIVSDRDEYEKMPKRLKILVSGLDTKKAIDLFIDNYKKFTYNESERLISGMKMRTLTEFKEKMIQEHNEKIKILDEIIKQLG